MELDSCPTILLFNSEMWKMGEHPSGYQELRSGKFTINITETQCCSETLGRLEAVFSEVC